MTWCDLEQDAKPLPAYGFQFSKENQSKAKMTVNWPVWFSQRQHDKVSLKPEAGSFVPTRQITM